MGITRAAFYNLGLTLHHIRVTPPSRAGNRHPLLKSSRRMLAAAYSDPVISHRSPSRARALGGPTAFRRSP